MLVINGSYSLMLQQDSHNDTSITSHHRLFSYCFCPLSRRVQDLYILFHATQPSYWRPPTLTWISGFVIVRFLQAFMSSDHTMCPIHFNVQVSDTSGITPGSWYNWNHSQLYTIRHIPLPLIGPHFPTRIFILNALKLSSPFYANASFHFHTTWYVELRFYTVYTYFVY